MGKKAQLHNKPGKTIMVTLTYICYVNNYQLSQLEKYSGQRRLGNWDQYVLYRSDPHNSIFPINVDFH